MRYWAYIGGEIKGPFDRDALVSLKEFSDSLLLCREGAQSGGTADWKPASSFPEVMAPTPPAPAQPTPAPAPAPAPAPEVPKPATAAESPLALTMRGSLILDPETEKAEIRPAAAQPPAGTPLQASINRSVLEPPKQTASAAAAPGNDMTASKLDQIGAMLLSVSNGQTQLLSKMNKLETELAAVKALIVPQPPKKP